MNRDHSVVLEIAPKYCISDPFVDYEGYSISSKGFLSTAVNISVIWIKFTHSIYFSSLIPKMSIFTFANFCLTMSNLPRFMDLTFQVPMQFFSLQYQAIPSPLVTSFFLEIFLHSSPVAYWTTTTWFTGKKTLMLGKIEGRRRRDDRGWDGWMASPTQWTWVWASSRS